MKEIDSFAEDLSLEDANEYMDKILQLWLYRDHRGFFRVRGGIKVLVIGGFWSEDEAEIEFVVEDNEYYATRVRKYTRNRLYYDEEQRFHIPKVWIDLESDKEL